MCPFCVISLGLIVTGVVSTGALAAFTLPRNERKKRTDGKGASNMSTSTVENPKIVSREEWLVARKKLLEREKQLTHERDAVAAERRRLPWVKVEKSYLFDSPDGKKTLADLFGGKEEEKRDRREWH